MKGINLVLCVVVILPVFFCNSCASLYLDHQAKKEMEEFDKKLEKMPYGKQVLEDYQNKK